MMEVGFIKLVF